MTRSRVTGRAGVERVAGLIARTRVPGSPSSVDDRAPATAARIANPIDGPVKNARGRVARSSAAAGRAIQATATAIPSRARM